MCINIYIFDITACFDKCASIIPLRRKQAWLQNSWSSQILLQQNQDNKLSKLPRYVLLLAVPGFRNLNCLSL